ncbi:hypothetical protein DID80_06390 [Candidatus Marinamargulisbacteria bacterium SCGC AAA071-K20]|nr:hypothetical protein DID80_06390 [Candidatus Marinamargulisbacteria bacterium SCGC AAA071-K20]
MRRLVSLLLFALLIPIGTITATQNVSTIDDLIAQATTAQLDKDPTWLKLLHYRKKVFSRQFSSDIVSPEFFLSPEGHLSPKAEMDATLMALLLSPSENNNEHAQCTYPARYMWLSSQLKLENTDIPKIDCQNFKRWSLNGEVDSISVLFASGYLKNPASFYGHILLKFNKEGEKLSDDYLDRTLNYGALLPPKENEFNYIMRGLFGGYKAAFTDHYFYRHNHRYTQTELRDVWEYKLNLSKQSTDFLVAHSWELLGQKYVYYFIDDNCATRMADLLELVTPEYIFPKHTPYSMPFTVFDQLVEQKVDGKPLVTKVRYFPSRQNQFYKSYSTLSKQNQAIVKCLAEDFNLKTNKKYQSLKLKNKQIVLDTLFDYVGYQQARNDEKKYKVIKQQLLIERFGMPQSARPVLDYRPSKPHEGQKISRLQLTALKNSSHGYEGEFNFRPAYYDLLTMNQGRLPNSKLTMFDIQLGFGDKSVWLNKFDIIAVETLNASKTHLPGDTQRAWNVRFGFEGEDLKNKRNTVLSLDGGIGKAVALSKINVFVMLDGRLQMGGEKGHVAINPRVGFVSTPFEKWRSTLSVGYRQYLDGTQSGEPVIAFKNRFGNSRRFDIQVHYLVHVEQELKVLHAFYW